MFGLGVPELLIIFAIIVVIFGAKKLPEIGSGLGKAIQNFKKANDNESDSTRRVDKNDEAGQSEGKKV